MKVFQGKVKSGRGKAATEMSKADGLRDWESLTGLKIIPGTLNLSLPSPVDRSLLTYIRFSELGWDFSPATQGIHYKGEIGMYYGRIIIAETFPGGFVLFTWVPDLQVHGELVSTVHLRSALNLQDGDTVTFKLCTRG